MRFWANRVCLCKLLGKHVVLHLCKWTYKRTYEHDLLGTSAVHSVGALRMHSLQLVGLLQDTHSTKVPTRGELEPIFVSASYCHSPADPDGRGPAPVSEGEPAAGAILQSPTGEGHSILPAAPNDQTLTPSLMECIRVHLLCMNRVHTVNCTHVVYQYCDDIGMIACRLCIQCIHKS